MARKFSYPEVQQLEVGGTEMVDGKPGEVARKVNAYAARSRKQFVISQGPTGETLCGPGPRFLHTSIVTRLPDPEPEVA